MYPNHIINFKEWEGTKRCKLLLEPFYTGINKYYVFFIAVRNFSVKETLRWFYFYITSRLHLYILNTSRVVRDVFLPYRSTDITEFVFL